jgi:hypothetical protein
VKRQNGFALVVAIVIVMVAAVMALALVVINTAGTSSSAQHVTSAQALFAAESGAERALYGYSKQGAACAALTYTGTIALAGAQAAYSTTGTSYTPANTSLAAAISATATVIPVASVAGYAPHGRITVVAEAINYTGTSTSAAVCGGSPACFTGATRGAGGTTAAAHSAGDAVSQNQCLVRATGTSDTSERVVERSISAVGSGTNGAMIVYAREGSAGVPYFRLWNGAAWGAEQTATSVASLIKFIVLKRSRTRNETILGTQASNGQIRVQVWNGSTWSATTTLANVSGADSDFRSFDIEYETSGDRAIVVFKDSANSTDPDYVIWDGTSWSAPVNINLPTAGEVRWVELAANPLPASNEIAMITVSSDEDVYGMAWNGAAWGNMGVAATWDTSSADSATKVIDVAYETLSGRAMFIWGGDSSDENFYRRWDGTTLGATTALTIAAMGGTVNWARLASDPFSNNIIYGVQDSGADLNTCLWNESIVTWVSCTEHETTVEETPSMNFDIVFETNPAASGQAWVMWGQTGSPGPCRRRQWTGVWNAPTTFVSSGDCDYFQLVAHPVTGIIFAGIYQEPGVGPIDRIAELRWNGAVWSAEQTFGTSSTIGDPVFERVDIVPDRGSTGIVGYDWLEIFP